MQTKNLIQASANVIKITRLVKGDVVKLVEDGSYSGAEIYYGVVTDLLNSGDKSYVQIMRYKKSYNAIDCDIKTYSGDKDLSLFPASVEEVQEELKEVVARIERDLADEEKKLDAKRLGLQRAKEFVSFETSKKLRNSEFKEITQTEYAQLQQASKDVF